MILIGAYLIHGTSQILVQQAENAEISELEDIKRQILEMQSTMTTLSQYFYFDSQLEKIAFKEYTDYQEMVDDFKEYTAFTDYQKYYNNIVARISIFVQNDTLKENSQFVLADEEITDQEWYQRVHEKGNSVVWAYLPYANYKNYKYDYMLAMTRMIKTKTGEDVGALAIYIRPEQFEEYIYEREGTTFITLNGTAVIAGNGSDVAYEELREVLPDSEVDVWQERVTISGTEYVVTCQNVEQKGTSDYIQVVSVRAMSDILADTKRQTSESICLSVLCVILAVSIIAWTTWRFGKRIDCFREQMQKAAAGNFELEKQLGGDDEISELYDYLNTMILDIQRLLAGIYQEKIHVEQLKTKQKDAEFMMLTSQINPHFLYNTLETIRMKARINNQYEIEELVKMLAKILRRNIQAGEKDVTIRSEVELVEYYLKIQQYRFGDKIQYRIEVEDEVEDYMILPLLLQPIVENAIVHGLEKKENAGHIFIEIRKQEEEIIVLVSDDGIGIEADKLAEIQKELKSTRLKGEHIGICNVQHRIHLKYGKEYGVSIESKEGEGTFATVRLPGMTEE